MLGYEALARPPRASGPARRSDRRPIGRGHELDAVCRRAALRGAASCPTGALLFLNVSPQTLEHDGLAGDSLVLAVRGAGYEPEQVVLEITERTDARKEQRRSRACAAAGARIQARARRRRDGQRGPGDAAARSPSSSSRSIARRLAAVEERGARGVMLAIAAFAPRERRGRDRRRHRDQAMVELARDPHPNGETRTVGAQGAQGYLLGRPAPVPKEDRGNW